MGGEFEENVECRITSSYTALPKLIMKLFYILLAKSTGLSLDYYFLHNNHSYFTIPMDLIEIIFKKYCVNHFCKVNNFRKVLVNVNEPLPVTRSLDCQDYPITNNDSLVIFDMPEAICIEDVDWEVNRMDLQAKNDYLLPMEVADFTLSEDHSPHL